VTFRRPNTAGNLIVAYVVWDNAASVSVTDSRGKRVRQCRRPDASARRPGARPALLCRERRRWIGNTVTATFSTAITGRGVLYALEYSGLDRLAPLDAAAGASGASRRWTAGR
jgi:hypothetical protein